MSLAFFTITVGVGGRRPIFHELSTTIAYNTKKVHYNSGDNNLSKGKFLQKTFSNLTLYLYSLNIHTKLKFLSFSISISLIFLTSKMQIIPRNASPVNVLCRVPCSVTL
jgi:hypothetical protein